MSSTPSRPNDPTRPNQPPKQDRPADRPKEDRPSESPSSGTDDPKYRNPGRMSDERAGNDQPKGQGGA
jgi:hypothetical protein